MFVKKKKLFALIVLTVLFAVLMGAAAAAENGQSQKDPVDVYLAEDLSANRAEEDLILVLKADITLDAPVIFTGTNITLDLNGYTLCRNVAGDLVEDGYVLSVEEGASLNVRNGSTSSDGVISGGKNSGNGGAIVVNGGRLTLNGDSANTVKITENFAANGGGIYAASGTVTINSGVNIIGNRAVGGNGGGIYSASGNVFTVSGVNIAQNTALFGGGIYVENGKCTLAASLSDNTASCGGGIYVAGGLVTLNSCSVTKNTVSSLGGGVFVASAPEGEGAIPVYVNDEAIVLNNTCGSSASNLYLAGNNNALVLDEQHPLTGEAMIGISFEGMETAPAWGTYRIIAANGAYSNTVNYLRFDGSLRDCSFKQKDGAVVFSMDPVDSYDRLALELLLALDACEEGQTVRAALKGDCRKTNQGYSTTITIPAGKRVVLDLCGNSVSCELEGRWISCVFDVRGELTVIDTAQNAGTIDGGAGTYSGAVRVADGGVFTLENGNIISGTSITGSGIQVEKGGSAVITGGSVSSAVNLNGQLNHAVNVYAGGSLTVGGSAVIDDVYLPTETDVIAVSSARPFTEGASVSVLFDDFARYGQRTVVSGAEETDLAYFHPLLSACELKYGDGKICAEHIDDYYDSYDHLYFALDRVMDGTLTEDYEDDYLSVKFDSGTITVTLKQDCVSENGLGGTIYVGKPITVDLCGHAIDGGHKTDKKDDQNIFSVSGQSAALSIINSSEQKVGYIRGGRGHYVYRFSPFPSEMAEYTTGGAIYVDGGAALSIDGGQCGIVIEGCSADRGGAIAVDGNNSRPARMTLTGVTITGNTSKQGGGVHLSSGETYSITVSLTDCTVTGNTASGGGVYNGSDSDVTLGGKIVISGNTAPDGKQNDFYRNSSAQIVIDSENPLSGESVIGVIGSPASAIAAGLSEEQAGCFVSNDPNYSLTVGEEGRLFLKKIIESYSLTLGGELGMNFFVNEELVPEDAKASAYMKFTVHKANGENEYRFACSDVPYEDGRYRFTCPVSVLQVGEIITAEFHYGDLTATERSSVNLYLNTLIVLDGYSDALKTLARSVRNYAHYAQLALQVTNGFELGGEDGYAVVNADHEIEVLAADGLNEFKPKSSGVKPTEIGIIGVECSLALDDKTSIKLYVSCGEGAEPENWTVKVNGGEAVTDGADGILVITIPEIPAHQLGKVQTVAIDGVTLKISALSFGCAVLNDPEATEESTAYAKAVTALYDYYVAADTYDRLVNGTAA